MIYQPSIPRRVGTIRYRDEPFGITTNHRGPTKTDTVAKQAKLHLSRESAASGVVTPTPAQADVVATAAETTPDANPPVPLSSKRRKGLMGSILAAQVATPPAPNDGELETVQSQSSIDRMVDFEMVNFKDVCRTVRGDKTSKYIVGGEDNPRFNLHAFWADKKALLPLHFGVYVSMVGCVRAAAANCETVFSGAGKFMEEAPSTGSVLLRQLIRCHYNYRYWFLRPSLKQVKDRYTQRHGKESNGNDAAASSADPISAGSTPVASTAVDYSSADSD